jgi:hypothetical protein
MSNFKEIEMVLKNQKKSQKMGMHPRVNPVVLIF